MTRYAMLILPSANRVYAESAVALTVAELEVFNQAALDGRITEISPETIGGVPYVVFTADHLDDGDIRLLSNASSAYALFRMDDRLLAPVELVRLDRYDDDLVTILKYQGKTNEQFTKLLLNVTLLSSRFADQMLDRRFQVMDPLCGRGTTLNQALMYGYHASGVDLDKHDFEAYAGFISTWLKRKRIKHQLESGPVRREKRVVAHRLTASLAHSKEAYRAHDTQQLDVVRVDTTRCLEFFKPETMDLIVTDAPYGVQHGSRTAEKGLARNPLALLDAAAPVWARLLRPGGALGVAWNTLVAGREEVAEVLVEAGLEPLDGGPYAGFRHRVDQAIIRDIIIARKA